MDEPTKIVVMGDDPESIAQNYEDKELIVIYPKGKRPRADMLLRKNIVRIFSDYGKYPDIEDLELIKNTIFYLLNSSYIDNKDRILLLFSKEGEEHRLFFDMSKMNLPNLVNMVSDRIKGEIVENILKLAMSIVKRGREGTPAGALFIVGDTNNVKNYVIQKIANPISGIDREMRSVLNEENFDTLREFAIMDGATLIDNRGVVVSTGVYVKNLSIEEWLMDGFGGRHLAARSITKLTKAISFAVSAEGTISVYRDGEKIYELKDF
ncbi:conserved domain protein [Aciduliprofundum boonei T469]|nr:conserved domain protein [Aciduliprofundum boonei T469]